MYKIIEEKFVNYVTIEGVRTALVIAHIICDTASDIPEPLPHWVAGSRCDVLENGGSVYVLSNAGEFEQVNFYNQGGGGEFDPDNYYTKTETDYEITEKVAEIVADAPEDFDTLKEMSDWIDSHEDSAAAMNSEIRANTLAISGKVDKVTGKGLSTEDYSTSEKTKLAGIEAGAEVNIQPDWEQSDSTADDFIKNKPTLGSAASRSAVLSLSNAGSGLPTSGTVYNALENKVDKVAGKGLSTEDYTTAEKTKLDGIEAGANNITVDSALSSTSRNPVQNNVIYNALYYLGAAIESRTDLNDLTVPGTYYSSSSSISGSLLNCPLKFIGFKLRVYYTSSTARIEQEIIPNIIDSTYHEIYKRSIVSGTAGDWYKFTGEVVQANT